MIVTGEPSEQISLTLNRKLVIVTKFTTKGTSVMESRFDGISNLVKLSAPKVATTVLSTGRRIPVAPRSNAETKESFKFNKCTKLFVLSKFHGYKLFCTIKIP